MKAVEMSPSIKIKKDQLAMILDKQKKELAEKRKKKKIMLNSIANGLHMNIIEAIGTPHSSSNS